MSTATARDHFLAGLPSREALAAEATCIGLAVPVVALVALEVLEAQKAAGALAALVPLRGRRRRRRDANVRLLALGRVAALRKWCLGHGDKV